MLHETLYIYKHLPWVREGYDPSNGGITSKLNEVEVFSADATNGQIAEWCLKHRKRPSEVMRLKKRMLWGEKHYFIEPVKKPKNVCGPMFGGSYADTSNCRAWPEMLGERIGRPIPVHDRFETQEQYDALSC